MIRNTGVGKGADWWFWDPIAAIAIESGTANGAVGNDIYDVGSNGVLLAGGDRKTLTPAGNYADNNYIHHVGVFHKQAAAIALNGVGNRMSHNLIHHCPRFATWIKGNDHVVEYNHIHHTSLETEDTGAIYTGNRDWISSRGSIIRYNYIHDTIGYGQHDGKKAPPSSLRRLSTA